MFGLFLLLINSIYANGISYDVEKIEFTSGYASYDSSKTLVSISTDAIINILDENDNIIFKIRTDYAEVDLSSSTISFSSFTIETSSVYIQGYTGDYNIETGWGKVFLPYTRYDRFILKSRSADIYKTKQIYHRAYMTTCDMPKPHYKITSSRITLSPKRYILSYNNVFYLGDVPIFYLPVLYKPLGEGTPLISQFYPGYDERNGFYIKSNYTYRISKHHKVRAYLDYYSKKGFGNGGEFFGYRSDVFKYNLSYYRINEYGKDPIYWGINGGVWYNLFSNKERSLYFQSFARLPSDPNFNNNYFRSNPFIISHTRQWDLSFTYQLPMSYLRLKASVLYNSRDGSFHKYEEVLPKVEYQMLTKKVSFLPLSHSLYLSMENTRYDGKYFQKHSKANYSLYKSVNFSKSISGYTSLSTEFDVLFATAPSGSNTTITRYLLNSSLRYSVGRVSVDFIYKGQFRSEVNKFVIDSGSSDGGIEMSRFFSKVMFINSLAEYFSLETSYDFNAHNHHLPFSKRISPLSVEYYKLFSNYELYFKESYSFRTGHKNFVANMSTHLEKNYLKVGFANYDNHKERLILSTILGYNPLPTKGWYGEFGFRYYLDLSKDMRLKFFEKNIAINKEFHDFNTKFTFRSIKGNNEFFFYITMKMNDPYRKDSLDSEIDKEFRPWRRFNEERDY